MPDQPAAPRHMSRDELIAEAKRLALYCDDPEWKEIVARLVASLEAIRDAA